MGALYSARMCLPFNALTTLLPPAQTQTLLAEAWGIHNQSDTTGILQFLLNQGHRQLYATIQPALAQPTAQHAPGTSHPIIQTLKNLFNRRKPAPQRAGSQVTLESFAAAHGVAMHDAQMALRTWSGIMMMKHSSGIGAAEYFLPEPTAKSIAAWDAARVVHVTRMAFDAGYFDETTAWETIEQAVQLSRQHYASWRDFGIGFYYGRAFWCAITDPARPGDADNIDFWFSVEELLKTRQEKSPWNKVPF